ncbi:MAG: 4Fe-4S ferredoxin [Anaerolineae bacterium SM23_ 63]|nr:MAG: 4Fe-4S ferredoxin [Anaerolineae bacterium SM23_ 63]HEY47747.1 4Fe-4S binding protein [Anaerolineae bacterium]
MSRPLWFVKLLKKAFPGRFLLAKTTKVPILGSMLDHALFEGDDLMYLPRSGTIEINQPINSPGEVVIPTQVVNHFIEGATVHWVMDTCICRQTSQCEDYPRDLGCLFLGEAALDINPELGRRVSKEEALEHVQRCREAGLVHLIGRNKLDTVWLGVEPGIKLLTICSCCPCCCLWRVLPHVSSQIGSKITRMPGVTVEVTDLCVGCGTCTDEVCFVDAIRLVDGRAVKSEACRGCGRCVDVCPEGAIVIRVEDDKIVERAINHITSLVDIS